MSKWMKRAAALIVVGLIVWGCPWDKKDEEGDPMGPDTTNDPGTGIVVTAQAENQSGTYTLTGNTLVFTYKDTSRECNGSTMVIDTSTKTDTIEFTLSNGGNTLTANILEHSGDSSNCPETTVVTGTRTGGGTSVMGTWTLTSIQHKFSACSDSIDMLMSVGATISGTLTIGSGTYSLDIQLGMNACLTQLLTSIVGGYAMDTSLHLTVTFTGCSELSVTGPQLHGALTAKANANNTLSVSYNGVSCTTGNLVHMVQEMQNPTSCPPPVDLCLTLVIVKLAQDLGTGTPKLALHKPHLF